MLTIDSFKVAWDDREGPFTINMEDFTVLRQEGTGYFDPCTERELLLKGIMGWWRGQSSKTIYVSRYITPGYYHHGSWVDALHSRSPVPEVVVKQALAEIRVLAF